MSYASEDRATARSIGEALTRAGLEVWLDESALGGGDAWDQKIRRQIRECDYFMPIISAQTEARHEGYFRREWRLAVERTLDMADDHLFLVPVVIDATNEAGARVPERFLQVQWLRLTDGVPDAGLEGLARRLCAGDTTTVTSRRSAPRGETTAANGSATPATPAAPVERDAGFEDFPVEVPGQR
ncbi:MAG: toll/interleukin-1 receptor domain-containing protein, partial [Gammaproteobacteria bacterium]|nr:toll/interleukin-1 receptor domain-containing protein [Gammaproteobacteria bacterium]